MIFALMLIGMVQIILRTVWRNPIYGYIDIIEVGMIAFALFSISYVMREGGHVRMELLVRTSRAAHCGLPNSSALQSPSSSRPF
jgi:TRAP-type C4-dicarboxylate transport system permease small subunit